MCEDVNTLCVCVAKCMPAHTGSGWFGSQARGADLNAAYPPCCSTRLSLSSLFLLSRWISCSLAPSAFSYSVPCHSSLSSFWVCLSIHLSDCLSVTVCFLFPYPSRLFLGHLTPWSSLPLHSVSDSRLAQPTSCCQHACRALTHFGQPM